MKRTALLILLTATIGAASYSAKARQAPSTQQQKPVADTLAIYTGKYQREIHNDTFYVQIDLVNGDLVGTTLWDGNQMLLKHLSGDNFMVTGSEWGVKFIRDKDKKVTDVIVRGTDKWTKVNTTK